MKKAVILSGMRSTGSLHLGNYLGALKDWVTMQNEYECYFMVADWHALTTSYEDTSNIKSNINEMVIDWLSAGLDPEKCTMFLQSQVKEHAELHLLFSMIVPLSWLFRCPTYKDQLSQMTEKNITTYGFLGYPCLQAADILLYKANFVPVGEDQLPHVELTREIARRFNFLYKEIFPEPISKLTKAKVLPGIDGRKMSKSYNNTIMMSDSPEEIKKKINMMITDPERIRKTDPGHPKVCTVFSFHNLFSGDDVCNIENECKAGKIGCVACKRLLTDRITSHMQPIYERRQEIIKNQSIIKDVINQGNRQATDVASKTLQEVKIALNIDWSK